MKNAITPKTRCCSPIAVKYTEGTVINPEGILQDDSFSTLIYELKGPKPFICIDLGPSAPGGYPIFEIEAFEGEPILRTSYSDWYDYICDIAYREEGDFKRGTCKYLGPELPVLPANPYRYELYNICRTGKYIYPLIQGQQRFVLLTLDTPGTAVSIRSFHIHYTSSLQKYDGGFSSSDPKLNYLWDASIYTTQIATISNSQSIEKIEERMLVRTLTKGNEGIVLKRGADWKNYVLKLKCEISIHPDFCNNIRWMVRASDQDNGYVISLHLNGEVILYLRKNCINTEIARKKLTNSIKPNYIYDISTTIDNENITVHIEGIGTVNFKDSAYSIGSIGFCQTSESWAVVHSLSVSDLTGNELFCDNMADNLLEYTYTYAEEFIADGAKRDRLPWVGDLYWANENIYYSFGKYTPLENTIEMFRRHQCPDGFVWGTCYPENKISPALHNYGMYQSDIFSAWYIITIAYHHLFRADYKLLEKWYPSVKADAEYLINNIDSSGLFYQRFETSKGLWDHNLNDYGYYSYNNLVVAKAIQNTAFLAKELGNTTDYERYNSIANKLLSSTINTFFDVKTGLFWATKDKQEHFYLATAFALAFNVIDQQYAHLTIKSMCAIHEKEFQMGKTVILFMKGCFKYGFAEDAYKVLTGSSGSLDYLGNCTLNWIDSVCDDKGPACTTECMPYGHERIANGSCWNDSSHPDTAVAFLMSGYIAGVRPLSSGFKEFLFSPNPCSLSSVKATIPTPYGNINVSFEIKDDTLSVLLHHPNGTTPIIKLPEKYKKTAIVHIEAY